MTSKFGLFGFIATIIISLLPQTTLATVDLFIPLKPEATKLNETLNTLTLRTNADKKTVLAPSTLFSISRLVNRNLEAFGLNANSVVHLDFLTIDRGATNTTIRLQQFAASGFELTFGIPVFRVPISGAELIAVFQGTNLLSLTSTLVNPPAISISDFSKVALTSLKLNPITLFRNIWTYQLKAQVNELQIKQHSQGINVAETTNNKVLISNYSEILSLENDDLIRQMAIPKFKLGSAFTQAIGQLESSMKEFGTIAKMLLSFIPQKGRLELVFQRNNDGKFDLVWRWNFPFDIPIQVDLLATSQSTTPLVTRVLGLTDRATVEIFKADRDFPKSLGDKKASIDTNSPLINKPKDTDRAEKWVPHTIQTAMNFYRKNFGRNSYDNAGATVNAIIEVSLEQLKQNAAWAGAPFDRFFFGTGGEYLDNFEKSYDVVGHEYTHAVVGSTSRLGKLGQTSALNEHLADVFGIFVRAEALGEASDQIQDFLIGKADPNFNLSIPTKKLIEALQKNQGRTMVALRDMEHPERSLEIQPSSMNSIPAIYLNGCIPSPDNDNCGAHILSGIPNKAAVGIIRTLGIRKSKTLFYEVMVKRLSPNSDFQDYAFQLGIECKSNPSFTPTDCTNIQLELQSVGISSTVSPTPPITPDQSPDQKHLSECKSFQELVEKGILSHSAYHLICKDVPFDGH